VRVKLGGEQRIGIAREYDYRDGSTVTQTLKPVEMAAKIRLAVVGRMARVRRTTRERIQSVDSDTGD
jgi:hypothetical protein